MGVPFAWTPFGGRCLAPYGDQVVNALETADGQPVNNGSASGACDTGNGGVIALECVCGE